MKGKKNNTTICEYILKIKKRKKLSTLQNKLEGVRSMQANSLGRYWQSLGSKASLTSGAVARRMETRPAFPGAKMLPCRGQLQYSHLRRPRISINSIKVCSCAQPSDLLDHFLLIPRGANYPFFRL